MFDDKKAAIEAVRTRFEHEMHLRSVGARGAGEDYLSALADLIQSFDDGPASDPRLLAIDTTGQLRRAEEFVAWAEAERHRVRRALADVA